MFRIAFGFGEASNFLPLWSTQVADEIGRHLEHSQINSALSVSLNVKILVGVVMDGGAKCFYSFRILKVSNFYFLKLLILLDFFLSKIYFIFQSLNFYFF